MQAYKINGLLVEITTDVSLDFVSQRLLFKFELNQSDPKLPISLFEKDNQAACVFSLKKMKCVPFHLHSYEIRNVINAEYSSTLRRIPGLSNAYYAVPPTFNSNDSSDYVEVIPYLFLTLSPFENWKYPYFGDFLHTYPLKGLILVYSSDEIKNEKELCELGISYLTLSEREE